jgi:hypothetical protein
MAEYRSQTKGYLGAKPTVPTGKFMMIDDEIQEIHDVVVYRFDIRDVDDPEVYAAEPIFKWKESEYGKWVFEHAIETPVWHKQDDPMSFHTKFAITAKLKDKDYIIWVLKYKEDK